MDQSYSESDVSLSPSQILDRLQVLRQLQLLQRGKLQKQRLQYQETPETSSSVTEIVSHFSNSTSYNTFRSLLHSSYDLSNDATPRQNSSDLTPKVKEHDLIEGVSVLNLSQESEFIVNSPISTKSRISASSIKEATGNDGTLINRNVEAKSLTKKQIALDEMPILSPKQDFETLLLEKLKNELPKSKIPSKDMEFPSQSKKPFLRRGEGMNRFGLKKNNLVIQSTKSLPWRRKGLESKPVASPDVKKLSKQPNSKKLDIQILVTEPNQSIPNKSEKPGTKVQITKEKTRTNSESDKLEKDTQSTVDSSNCALHNTNKQLENLQPFKGKHTVIANKGKTWAAVLTKEQDDFLKQLKQSDYYKNFVSPAKSTQSDMSCDENLLKLRHERERAEQNMFELLENKVTNESFNLENSFISKFLKRNNFEFECSGESTPLIMQKCLANNPELMHIFPGLNQNRTEVTHSETETCDSEYTECCSDTCSSVSSCCSCKTVEAVNSSQSSIQNKVKKKVTIQKPQKTKTRKEVDTTTDKEQCHDKTVTEDDIIKADMAEMNAKLVATSELLKDRLQELEDEIETFRKENANLAKLREEVDLERQKFYEEKNTFEQKYNEEKILAEYYLAEEKEKLSKQKQTYERYVREMRGRLSKKEKDEVTNLKKEIADLKEEIRMKDAKSTSSIARLRNQIKIIEKEKKESLEEVEKLKKENRRIQHSNDVTRRLTNLKYLEQINKKLTKMSSKESCSEMNVDNDMKYKAFEIERQSRSRRVQPVQKNTIRPRAKSVPNLNVKSRYAKYFSQRDAVSQMDRTNITDDHLDAPHYHIGDVDEMRKSEDSNSNDDAEISDNDDNNLEKMYLERFQSTSPTSNRSSLSNTTEKNSFKENPDPFFICKPNTNSRDSKSPNETSVSPYLRNNSSSNTNRSKSPISNKSSNHLSPRHYPKDLQNLSNYSLESYSQNRSKSPISILSNRSSSQRLSTVINQDQYKDRLTVSPEPSTSKTTVLRTSLNPTEIKKPDGSKELRFPNGNVKYISSDGKYSKFAYYNGDVKENFYNEGRIKYFYAEAKTYHTTHADGLEVLEFPE